jgi:hypothetical protein
VAPDEVEHVQVTFPLERDELGWPPASAEKLWARRTAVTDEVELENIPLFARGVARGDRVGIDPAADGGWTFREVLAESGHSTVRIIVPDDIRVDEVVDHVVALGCEVERSHVDVLVSVDIPPDVAYRSVTGWLDEQEAAEVLQYEEGAIASHQRR